MTEIPRRSLGVMQRMWRSFRLFFLILVFLALTVFLVFTTPWRRWFGSPRSYAAEIQAGRPLVEAIYRFRAATNLWPEYLDDLEPAYIAQAPPRRWYYVLMADGPQLSTSTGERRTHVGYDFDGEHPRWRVFGEVENRVLMTDVAEAQGNAVGADVRTSNELRELDRRIAREPSLLEHRRAKASLLRSLDRDAEAGKVIDEAAAALPESFWPPLARATMENSPEGMGRFADWVGAHPGFTHQYYLALVARQLHDDTAATAAIEKSLTYPLELTPDDPDILAFYFWDMTRYALGQRRFALVQHLVDGWQRADADKRLDEKSYVAFRAASLLVTGDDRGAAGAVAALDTLNASSWAKHLPELKSAIARHDRAFLYDPGATPAPYAVFALPQ